MRSRRESRGGSSAILSPVPTTMNSIEPGAPAISSNSGASVASVISLKLLASIAAMPRGVARIEPTWPMPAN